MRLLPGMVILKTLRCGTASISYESCVLSLYSCCCTAAMTDIEYCIKHAMKLQHTTDPDIL